MKMKNLNKKIKNSKKGSLETATTKPQMMTEKKGTIEDQEIEMEIKEDKDKATTEPDNLMIGKIEIVTELKKTIMKSIQINLCKILKKILGIVKPIPKISKEKEEINHTKINLNTIRKNLMEKGKLLIY